MTSTQHPLSSTRLSDEDGAWLSVEIRNDEGMSCLGLAGELDIATTDRFPEAVAMLMPVTPRRVGLDLSDLEFLDLAGLQALLALRLRMSEVGISLILVGTQRRLPGRLLQITRADQILEGDP